MPVHPQEPAAVARRAVRQFDEPYGPGPGRPICIVIAAYNEAASIGAVIAGLPAEVAGRATEVVVIDDGSTDATAEKAVAAGALVCRLERNLGQGWALRSGYELAARRQAEVIATMDADGQFDPTQLGRVVEPVLTGAADMVVGSRRLGHSESTDTVRAAGVVFFARLISFLTRTTVTDPSNGFRAFTPEVPRRVPLRQAQYQAAELLIGAIGAGFRVTEVAVVVRARTAGGSKKGTNLLYGIRFGRVVVATWWGSRRAPSRPVR
jgi:glycosyltransferase involved in cell wall biosynthesis